MGRLSKRPQEAQANLSGFAFLLRPCDSYHPSPERTSVSKDFPERSGKSWSQKEDKGKAICTRGKQRQSLFVPEEKEQTREVKDCLHDWLPG